MCRFVTKLLSNAGALLLQVPNHNYKLCIYEEFEALQTGLGSANQPIVGPDGGCSGEMQPVNAEPAVHSWNIATLHFPHSLEAHT